MLTSFLFLMSPSYTQYTSHLYDISPLKHSSRVFKNVFYTRAMFPTNIVVSRSLLSDDTWYLVTNDNTSRAVHNYSYRFGSIESIFNLCYYNTVDLKFNFVLYDI